MKKTTKIDWYKALGWFARLCGLLLVFYIVLIGLRSRIDFHLWLYDSLVEYLASNLTINIWLIRSIAIGMCVIILVLMLNWAKTLLKPIIAANEDERKELTKRKNKATIGLGVFFVLFFLMMYALQYGTIQSCCYATNGISYEYVDCINKIHPKYGTEVKPCNLQIRRIIDGKLEFKEIFPDSKTMLFLQNGDPIAWYYRNRDSSLSFYNQPGRHPQYGIELLPVTHEIAEEFLNNTHKKDKPITIKLSENQHPQKLNITDYLLSKSFRNTPQHIEIAVFIIDKETKELNNLVSKGLSDLFSSKGYAASSPFFSSNIIKEGLYSDLFRSENKIAKASDLSAHIDFICIGEIQFSTIEREAYNSKMFVTTIEPKIYLIDTKNNQILKTIDHTSEGAEYSISESRRVALSNLIKFEKEQSIDL